MLSALATALGLGLAAGLALAVPLGAIGVLLIREGVTRGFARGAAAAAAVATVDTLYCAAALTVGAAAAPIIASWSPWPRVVGGTALLALACWGLIRAWASLARANRARPARARGAEPDTAASSARRYALFFGLTAVNPATLVYFSAIAAGLPAITTAAGSTAADTAAAFVVGVALASLSWQLLLVYAGALLRWRTGPRFQRATAVVGNGIVAILGLLMLISAALGSGA